MRQVLHGDKGSAISFGAVAGPLLAAFIGRWLAPRDIFTVAVLTMVAAAILAFAVLKLQGLVQYPASSCDYSVSWLLT